MQSVRLVSKLLETSRQVLREDCIESLRAHNRNYCAGAKSGSGSEMSGGTGGSIKEAGGGLSRYGAAQEEGYFFNKSKEQLSKLKKTLSAEEKAVKQKPEPEN